jgi:hypothetical protein
MVAICRGIVDFYKWILNVGMFYRPPDRGIRQQEEKKLDCGTWHWLTTTVDTRWKLSKITAYEWLLWLSGR